MVHCFASLAIFLVVNHARYQWRRCGSMGSAVVPGSSDRGSSTSRGHCVVFLGKTLNCTSKCLSPPRFINGSKRI